MAKPAHFAPPKNFESALAELESLVQSLESGQFGLEESLSAYQRGAELLKYCQGTLDAAEQRVRVLDEETMKDFSPRETAEG
jgi:exodeoxyribonuclease VII small subunit